MQDLFLSETLIERSDASVPIHAILADALEEALDALPPLEAAFARAAGFDAASGTIALIADSSGGIGRVLFGLGRADAWRRAPFITGKLPSVLKDGDYHFATDLPDPMLAALGWALGHYGFSRYKTARASTARLVVPSCVAVESVRALACAVTLVRDLVNTPANDLGPADLALAVRALGERHGARVREIADKDLLAANLPLIHAVGSAAAADRAPRLVDLVWGDPDHPKVTLVGKGVTFDTGGLDIKPSSGMLLMKKDMGGAANALALAGLIMEAGLPVRLRLLVPTVENAIAGCAMRPGDVLRSRAGLSVEIGNTDAEGRLILADALALAAEENPALLVDLATLTGAARVALGPDLPPFYTHDERLAADLARHAERVCDPLWRLPLWAPYEAMLDSKIADINNAGQGGFAGSITAALFLDRFVPKTISWLHADIYAWNAASRPGRPEGGEAQAIRALFSLICERYGG